VAEYVLGTEYWTLVRYWLPCPPFVTVYASVAMFVPPLAGSGYSVPVAEATEKFQLPADPTVAYPEPLPLDVKNANAATAPRTARAPPPSTVNVRFLVNLRNMEISLLVVCNSEQTLHAEVPALHGPEGAP
jgi:hypothetical protein